MQHHRLSSRKRDIRAPGAGTITWDDATHTTWTATYSGLVQADVDRAVAAQTRILWLGRDPLAGNELTTYEVGEVGGPAAPCVV